MPRKAYAMNLDDLIRLYESGLSEKACSEHLGVSRRYAHDQLVKAGVTLRSFREQLLLVAASRTPEERARIATAAHDAVRGSTRSIETLLAAALTREANPKISPHEALLAQWLTERGRPVRHQVAIGPYNADLTTGTVAVEVFGGNWHSTGEHRRTFPKRANYILDQGWHLIIVWDQKRNPLSVHAADYIVTFAQEPDRDPPGPREYRVIRGCGEELARGEGQFDDLALVPSQRNPSR